MDQRDWLTERFEADRGHLRAVAFRVTVARGKIVEIAMIADAERLRELDLTLLSD